MSQCEHGKHRLNATGAAQQVTRHGLGRADHQIAGMIAECRLDGLCFTQVAQLRGRPMGIEVLNLIRIDASIVQRHDHGTTGTVDVRRGNVMRVSTHAKPDNFGVNFGAPRFCMLVLFQDHNPTAFAQHEPVSVLVPGPRRRFRIFVAGRECAGRCKAANTQRRDGRFSSTSNHDVAVPILNHARR